MEATYSPIAPGDIHLLLQLMQEFYAIDNYPVDLERSRVLLSQFMANTQLGCGWLITVGQEAVGYCLLTFVFSLEYGGRMAFIDELYLTESARGQGIGKQTVLFLQAQARRLSVKMLYLEVEKHNVAAQKLYESAGFSVHQRKLMYYRII